MSNTNLNCRSEYVTMRDGVRLAVSIWLTKEYEKNTYKRPAVVITTRYWRAMAFKKDNPQFQVYYPLASYLSARDYVLVVVDARGSGASFGSRDSEVAPAEVIDIGEIIDWVAEQAWCDGRVATTGFSYTAYTTMASLATASPALKLGVCRALDFDSYRHLLAPGGVVNGWFIGGWGDITAAQDTNDAETLRKLGRWEKSPEVALNVLGVRPVDGDVDGGLLKMAIAEHRSNYNLARDTMTFSDRCVLGSSGLHFYQNSIEQGNLPAVVRCGWHDAGTQLGAFSLFTSFSNPLRVIIGPWNHAGDSRVDPFQPGDGTQPEGIPMDAEFGLIVDSLDATLKKVSPMLGGTSTDEEFSVVKYYTLGENQWKTTKEWPLPGTQMQRLYLSENYQLSQLAPEQKTASDVYQVDPSASTGLNNRWYCQLAHPVIFNDRQEEDKKLLVYDTPPLEQDLEITGHPVVHLFVRSTATDGQFFAYLETIDPDGYVRLLTEGQLRALHRKVSDETPPFQMFGPYHSLQEKDAEPLVPGEVAEIAFDLFPISVLLKKGQRIRLAIAGADKDTFALLNGCENPEITIERNGVYASCLDLPVV